MKHFTALFIFTFLFSAFSIAQVCIDCHKTVTPNIVSDWKISRHSLEGVTCDVCHGDEHKSAGDVSKVQLPTPEVCKACHEERVKQFSSGKHGVAWTAMYAMPTVHMQPMILTEGMKGCGGCHKIGLNYPNRILKNLKQKVRDLELFLRCLSYTAYLFGNRSPSPQACITCHMGFDHPQWEMYSTSKHWCKISFETIRHSSGLKLLHRPARPATCRKETTK